MADLLTADPGLLLWIAGITLCSLLAATAILTVLLARGVWRWLLAPALRAARTLRTPATAPPAPAVSTPRRTVRHLPCHSTRCAHLTTVHVPVPGGWACTTGGCGRTTTLTEGR
ncbi:hypothetical protein ACIOHE_15870 [Streptomyces sp. NPDC087851]|uniref:hypothetical protein n=1 Tax=Streptomyces sp. NPDC087851 TaxID=3365810 RepID=UPI0038278103